MSSKRHRTFIAARSIAVSLTALLTLCVLPAQAAQAAPGSTDAIRVSPALSNIQLAAGETSATVVATVTNLTSSPLSITIAARDFGASTAGAGSIGLYGNNYNPAANPHGLQTAISLNEPQLTLAPRASRQVPITLNDVNKLAAGGHYGAVLFSPAAGVAAGSHAKVSIQSAIASLIFLTTASGGTQTLRLTSFPTSPLHFSLPGSNYIAFKDTGNTQTAPQGQLTLYGPEGSIVSTMVLNPGSGLILPGTARLFTVLLPLSHAWLSRPGMYRLELQYRDGSQTAFTVVSKKFLYCNPVLLVLVVLIIVLIWYLLRRSGRRLMHSGKQVALRLAKRKRPDPAPEEKPKRPPRLIQG